jgi:hypothetical protein
MKQQPIEYAITYDREPAFTMHRNSAGVNVYSRSVVVRPGRDGSWVVMSIVDNYRRTQWMVMPSSTEPIAWDVERDSHTFQAGDYPKQAQLIKNLSGGDLRGRLAEDTAQSLLWDLYAFGGAMKKWLPAVYDDFCALRGSR